jgi:RNA polymerase-binding transcription factor DksA
MRTLEKKNTLTAARHAELRAGMEEDLRRLAFGRSSRGAGEVTMEAVQQLEPRARRRALGLLDALRRFDAGTYGICTGCGIRIPYVRLSAIPETTVCVECSGARELLFRA